MTVTDPNNVATEELTSPEALSYLISVHRSVEIPPCRVCGAELVIGSIGGGNATVYHCGSDEASSIKAGVIDRANGSTRAWGPKSREASDHWSASEFKVAYHGDQRLVAVLEEYRFMRQKAGENMTVPVGAIHYPYGHGKGHCSMYFVHQGGDRWSQEFDFDYAHDPDHGLSDEDDD